MKTRTRSAVKGVPVPQNTCDPKVQLGPESSSAPHVVMLPEDLENEARVVSLTNPRYSSKSRYIVSPTRGIYEFTKIATPRTKPRSWLLSPSDKIQSDNDPEPKDEAKPSGYISKAADLFIATPIDPLYFLLPAVAPPVRTAEPPKRLFLSSDDYFEKLKGESPHLSGFLGLDGFRTILERRLAAVCETAQAGDDTMYRLSEERLLQELLIKAKGMVQKGLPASMEEKLIRKALEVPMLSIKREESSMHELSNEEEVISSDSAETPETQSTISTTDSTTKSFSEASTAATSFSEEPPAPVLKSESMLPPINAPEGVPELLRLRTALHFICSIYVAPHISEGLKKSLASSTSPIDFRPLDTHLAHLTKLRQEALSARSLGDYSRKRAIEEDDETLEIRAEKKRKKEEDDKRKKAGVSVGLKKLQKVNTSGMKKMSDFFKKK